MSLNRGSAHASMDFDAKQRQLLARHELLIPLVNKQIIADAVGSTSLTAEQSKKALETWCKRKKIPQDEATLKEYCILHGMTEGDLHWQAELPIRIILYGKENFGHRRVTASVRHCIISLRSVCTKPIPSKPDNILGIA